MDKLVHVTGELMAQVLATACDLNLDLELSRQDDENRNAMKTSFVVCLDDGKLAVRIPTRDGTPILMRAREEVFITFNIHEQPYQFSGTVSRRDMISVNDGTRVPALILAAPPHIERIQRRSCFRVKLSSVRRKQGHLWLLEKQVPGGKLRARPLGQVEIADLSAGGAGLVVAPQQAELLKTDAEAILALPLDDPANFIRLQAIVRSVRTTATGSWQVGLQFFGLEETVDGRSLSQQIEHHVVALERDELQRLKRKV